MKIKTDIDIDVADRNMALTYLNNIPASMSKQDETVKHNTGVYFQNIPSDPLTNLSAINYQEAEELGYFKIDFINNSIYSNIKSNEHLERLMEMEPNWDLLGEKDFVEMLAHVRDHFDIVNTIKPRSIDDLAIVLALIRPGKRYLMHKSRSEIEANIWTPPIDGSYHFKKAHAYAYAVSIAVQMNLLIESVQI